METEQKPSHSPKEIALNRLRAGERPSVIARELNLNVKTVEKWGQRDGKKAVTIGLHHNSGLNQRITEGLADQILTRPESQDDIGRQLGISGTQAEHHRKVFRRILLPEDYPADRDAWRDDVIKLMEIAIWKAAWRLADHGMEEMQLANLSVAQAIAIEKHALLSGSPTSFTAHLSASISPGQMLHNLTAKPTVVVSSGSPVSTTCDASVSEVSRESVHGTGGIKSDKS